MAEKNKPKRIIGPNDHRRPENPAADPSLKKPWGGVKTGRTKKEKSDER